MSRYILLVVSLLALGCAWSSDGPAKHVVSMSALLSDPTEYDGLGLIVTGYVCKVNDLEYGIFLTKTDCADYNYSNGIHLDVSKLEKKIPKDNHLLTVEGVFQDRSDLVSTDQTFIWGTVSVTNMSGRNLR